MRRFVFAALVLGALAQASISLLQRGESVRLAPPSDGTDRVRAHWEAELAQGVGERPDLEFANLSREEFIDRLDRAAERYDFDVEHVEFLEPKQLAPMVVVRSTDPFALAKIAPKVADSLNPHAPTGDDRTGWAWEGFYFEARDRENRPAFVILTFWRRGGGGQWAAEEDLFPFPHGSAT